jgi:hypothetical protein
MPLQIEFLFPGRNCLARLQSHEGYRGQFFRYQGMLINRDPLVAAEEQKRIASGSSCVRNTPLLQAHLVLDKTNDPI